METVASKLISLRKSKKLTQEQLANKIHVSRKTISNWENNRGIPDIKSLNSICNIYNIPLNYFSENKEKYNIDNESVKKYKILENKLLKYSFYLNAILTILSIFNLFIVGKYHLSFITPVLIINLCVFFAYYPNFIKIFKMKIKKIILIFLIIFFISTFLEVGVVLDVNNNFIDPGIIFGIVIHCISLSVGFDTVLFFK